MSEQTKVRIVLCPVSETYTNIIEEWEQRIDALEGSGYRLVFVDGNRAFMEYRGNDYSNVTNLKDVPPDEVDQYIADGWEITSTSISTKFIRMVKRK